MPRKPRHSLAARIVSRLQQLATISSSPGDITRLYLTKEHRAAADLVAGWMREAGMSASLDATGTVVGRIEGSTTNAKTLLLGSHIDTVRNAGRFDGCLGVVAAIEAIAELQRLRQHLPFAVEVLAFGDEEGVRFSRTLTSSHAVAGSLSPVQLGAADADGITIADALSAFGCDPTAVMSVARQSSNVLGYIELHIEQGPVLENEGLPVGIVTAITGASRFRIEVVGRAGHAGTLPMHMRRDALTGAAEIIMAVERIGRETAGLVATVGHITVSPGAVNVIPGAANLTLDIRSPMDRTRRQGVRDIERESKAIARRRQLEVKLTETYDQKAATCDQRFIRHLSAAVETLGHVAFGLPSGAGHDGLALSELCPIGMLFVRCKSGISHHPEEFSRLDDIEVATRVLIAFLSEVAPSGRAIA